MHFWRKYIMNKMKFETPDMTAENIKKIAELFPNCVTEMRDENGKVKRGINFEVLKQILSSDVVDGDECYEFTWVGKKASIAEANKPIRKTLRPCPEESKDWDTTENLYIEGDNLEVLKLLQESYLGKVKMIYIDPPYNTGNDFIYADDFMRSQQEENEQMGMYDEDENRLFKNTDSNGRFHSDWCSMMYSRLMLARNLLSDDGVIFISIDDNEQANLKKICDEIFGEHNFVANMIWHNNKKGRQMDKFIKNTNEYAFIYAKNNNHLKINNKKAFVNLKEYTNKDNISLYKKGYPLHNGTAKFHINNRPNLCYSIYYSPDNGTAITIDEKEKTEDGWKISISETGRKLMDQGYVRILPKKNNRYNTQRVWRWGQDKFLNEYAKDLIFVEESEGWYIYQKERVDNDGSVEQKFTNYVDIDTARGKNDLNKIFDNCIVFDFSKPVELIQQLGQIITNSDMEDIVLDFFSGSATTAHAVMQLNAEDNGHRKFIMVQLSEPCDEQSEAYKAGYKNICEIGKERIRRAGEKIKAENGLAVQNLDVGFRVLKLADSNMKDIYYAADDYKQADLLDMVSNIKDDRSDLDLLFGCLIDWGLPLSMPYTSEKIEGCTVHTYNDGDLIACFDENIPESVVKEIASRKPLRAVFRDSSFASSPAKINVFEIFKLYMPEDADDISKRVRVI